MKPVIYCAGPYTASTKEAVERNVWMAQSWGAAVNRTNLAWALCPHNMGLGLLEDSLDEAGWYDFTLELSRRCDGVLMLPGWTLSRGSVGEQLAANMDGRPWVVADAVINVETSVRALLALIEARQ